MSLVWDQYLSASAPSCNITIVCSDGIILSHKIIVASASDFLKRLMKDTDNGLETTILLLDFHKDQMENLFSIKSLQQRSEDYFGVSTLIKSIVKQEEQIEQELFEVKADPDCFEQRLDIAQIKCGSSGFDSWESPSQKTGLDYQNYFDENEKLEIQHSIMKLLEELERKSFSKPSNSKEEKVHILLQKQILYERQFKSLK